MVLYSITLHALRTVFPNEVKNVGLVSVTVSSTGPVTAFPSKLRFEVLRFVADGVTSQQNDCVEVIFCILNSKLRTCHDQNMHSSAQWS